MPDMLGNPALLMAAMAMRNPNGQQQPPPFGLLRGLLIGVAVAGGAVGLFLIGRKFYRDAAQNAALNRSDKESEPSNYAQRLINAFANDEPFGLGTNEELVRDTIRAVPHLKFWEDVKTEYHKLTGKRNLIDDMREELSTQMLREINLILADLPKDARDAANRDPNEITATRLRAWADRIKMACDYEASFAWPWGTDESAVHAVLMDVPTAKALCSVDRVYRTAYGKGLFAQLTEEMEGDDLARCYQLIMMKPDVQGKSLTQVFALCR